eukprot:7381513-Prymnesium_polylepis.2
MSPSTACAATKALSCSKLALAVVGEWRVPELSISTISNSEMPYTVAALVLLNLSNRVWVPTGSCTFCVPPTPPVKSTTVVQMV